MSDGRVGILGVGVNATNMAGALRTIENRILARERGYICVTSAHGIVECQSSPELLSVHDHASMVLPDGMPLVLMGQWLGHKNMRQVYGPDLMWELSKISAGRSWRHFYYGGAPGVAEILRARMETLLPGLQIVGTLCPPFRPMSAEEDAAAVHLINSAAPDIVWVGLSTPKQERWMADHVERLNATLIGVGAAFDFLSGQKSQPPRWIQGTPFQWMFRLATEPRRLWRRYARVVPQFTCRAAWQLATSHRRADLG